MKIYLSSYHFGDNPNILTSLFTGNKKVGLIMNAIDFSTDLERSKRSTDEQLHKLSSLGLKPQILDLKEYFEKPLLLKEVLLKINGLWVYGGNTFVLAYAYEKSGLKEFLNNELLHKKDFVYAGFSAGGCVLQKSFLGLEYVDNPKVVLSTYGQSAYIPKEGVGLLDYRFVPHFDSEHPESEDTNLEIDYYKSNGIKYKALRDGEVIIDELK